MAQRYDVSLKTLFLYSHGIMSKLLFGGPVAEWLNVEQPEVRNLRADMLARGQDGGLRHVEFQGRNEDDMPLRQLEYYVGFRRKLGEHVEQVVLYAGKEPLRMAPIFVSPSTRHQFRIINLREMDGEPLLQSDDWGDNALALLTRADRERVFQVVERRLRQLDNPEQEIATRTFVLLSGILGLEEQAKRRIDTGMIDMMENKVFAPIILTARKGGIADVLTAMLQRRFGPLPTSATDRIQTADADTLERWSLRFVDATTLDQVFD